MLNSIIGSEITLTAFLICTAVSLALGDRDRAFRAVPQPKHAELCNNGRHGAGGRTDDYYAGER